MWGRGTVAVVVPEGTHRYSCTGEVRCEQGRREARGEEGQSCGEEGQSCRQETRHVVRGKPPGS